MSSVPFMFGSSPKHMVLNKDMMHIQARDSSEILSPAEYFDSQSPLIPLYDLNVQILSKDMDKVEHSSNSGRPRAQEQRQDTSHTFGQNIKAAVD